MTSVQTEQDFIIHILSLILHGIIIIINIKFYQVHEGRNCWWRRTNSTYTPHNITTAIFDCVFKKWI